MIVEEQVEKLRAALEACAPIVGPSTEFCPHCNARPSFVAEPAGFPLAADGKTFASLVAMKCKPCGGVLIYVHPSPEFDARRRVTMGVKPESAERFRVVSIRERAHALADEMLGGKVRFDRAVPIAVVEVLAQAVLDYRDEPAQESTISADALAERVVAQIDQMLGPLEQATETYAARQHPTGLLVFGSRQAGEHARWMVVALRSNETLRADPMKIWRWLGSVFGILLAIGEITIDDVRRIVTEAGC